MTADVGDTFEFRWDALLPRAQWTNSYYSPVGTTPDTGNGNSGCTEVWIYNPAPPATTNENVRDEFSAVSYGNNNGSKNWSTDWVDGFDGGSGPVGGDGHLYFSMGYEDVDSISISQETTKVGALKERRVNVQGLEILGALGVEVFATMTLSRDDVTTSTLRSGRPFFDQVVHAAATYRMDLDPTLADRYQLKRVLDGEYEMEDDELVAALIVDRV